MEKEIEFSKVTFTSGELRGLPSIHSGALVSTCLAINEINSFLKITLLAENSGPPARDISEDILTEIAHSETIIYIRNLSSKILEYMNMIGDYKKKCERNSDSSMQSFIDKATKIIDEIRTSNGYNLALWYRNTVTNHYLVSEITKLVREGDIGADNAEHSIYLHEKEGNSGYVLGEQILLAKLSENGNDPIEQNLIFHDWVISSARKIVQLHHEFCLNFLDKHCPNKKAVKVTLTPEAHLTGHLKDTCLPIILDVCVSE